MGTYQRILATWVSENAESTMKRIHTKFSTFKTFESKIDPSSKSRIIGVFSQRDYNDYMDTIIKIGQSRGITINWFPWVYNGKIPFDWKYNFRDGRLLVMYDLDPTLPYSHENGVTYIPAIVGMTVERDGLKRANVPIEVYYAGDNRDRSIPIEKAQELISGYDHLWPLLSEYGTNRQPEDLSVTEMFELLMRLYHKLEPVLSKYDAIKRPDDPSVSEVMDMLINDATDENLFTADKIMSNAKVWVEENRKANPSLMAALRHAYPKEYQKMFPDEDISADMGDLGF